MKKFYSIIAAVVLSATVMSGSAWAAVATYTWTIADFVDDVDNGLSIGIGQTQEVNCDTLDLTGETALELFYVPGTNGKCTFGHEAKPYLSNGFSYKYYVELNNGNGTLVIPKISGSGKLTLLVGPEAGTFTVQGRNAKGEIATTPVPMSVTEQGSVQTVSWDLSGLVYENVEIKASFNGAMVFVVSWEPNSYFWEWTRIGIENGVTNSSGDDYYGNNVARKYLYFHVSDGYVPLATSGGNKSIFFKSSLSKNEARIFKEGSEDYPFTVYAGKTDACSFLTDPISCVGGTLVVKIKSSSNPGTLDVSILDGDVIAGNLTFIGSKVEVNINRPLNNEQLKISSSGGLSSCLYIEFIPSDKVTDRAEVASGSKKNGTITFSLTGSNSDGKFNKETISRTGSVSATGLVALEETAGYAEDPELFEESASVETVKGSQLAYAALPRTKNIVVSGLLGKHITIAGNEYEVMLYNGNYYIDLTSNHPGFNYRYYKINSATWSESGTYSFIKWTTDDAGFYDYSLDANTSKLSDGSTLYAHFTKSKILPCAVHYHNNSEGGTNAGSISISTTKVAAGESTIVSAVPNPGYVFVGWYETNTATNCESTDLVHKYQPTGESRWDRYAKFSHPVITCAADYVTGSESLGTAYVNSPGSTALSTYLAENVTFRAVANSNAEFVGWFRDEAGEDMVSASDAYEYYVQENKTLYAKFARTEDADRATLNVSIKGHGTITSNNSKFNLGSETEAAFATYQGQSAIFTATPDAGYRLDYWTVNGTIILNPSRSYFLTVDRSVTSIVANFARDSRSTLTWWGERRDWTIGQQNRSVTVGSFTFDASSTLPAFVQEGTSITYKGTEYAIPYSFTTATRGTHNYIKVAANGPGLLTIVARNTSGEAQQLKIYANTSKYNGAVASSTPTVTLDVPVSAGSGYSELTCNLDNNTGDFLIATTGALDIYYIKFRGSYLVTVSAEHGTVTSTVTTTTTGETIDLTTSVSVEPSRWNPRTERTDWENNPAIGTIRNTSIGVQTRDGRSVYLVEDKFNTAYHSNNVKDIDTVLMQRVTGLENGVYQVTVYANAYHEGGKSSGITQSQDGIANIAAVFANKTNQYIPAHYGSTITESGEYTLMAYVTDGTLDIGMMLLRNGTNWHTMQIKSIDNLSLWSEDKTDLTGVGLASYTYNTSSTPNGDASRTWQRKAQGSGEKYINYRQVPDIGNDGGSPWVYRNDGTLVMIVERFQGQLSGTGRQLWQEIPDLEPGSYTVTLYASSCNTGDRDQFDNYQVLTDGDRTYTYVYANGQKAYIPSYRTSSMVQYEEVTLTTEVGEDGKLELGIFAEKNGTNWHCIQVKSLYYNKGAKRFNSEDVVHMIATPESEKYRFTGWTLDGAEAGNGDRTLTFTVTNDHNVVANFAADSRDPNLWQGEPLDWIYGLQTASLKLGNFTFRSNSMNPDRFEKDAEGNVVEDSKGNEYSHRFSILGPSAAGGRYLLVEPTESGTLELVVRNPNSTLAKIYFRDGASVFSGNSGTGTAITNSEGDYQIVTHDFTYGSNKSFVVSADAALQIYALRYEGQAIAILPTDGEIPEGYEMSNAAVTNVTDVNSTMYGNVVVQVTDGKTSTVSVPHYVRVDKVKLRGTTVTTNAGSVAVNSSWKQLEANGGTEISELEYSISSPAYDKDFTLATSANGFMGIVTLYGKVHKHYSEPTFSYDYRSNVLTMASAESGIIYFTTSKGMTADNATSFGEAYSSAIDLSERAASVSEFDSVTYYAVVPSSVSNWQNNDNAYAPSVVASYTVYFYPKTMGYCAVETGVGQDLRDAVTYANAAASESNPVTIFVPWGTYDLGESVIEVDDWVSLIGSSNAHTFIKSQNSRQTMLVKGNNNYLQDLQIVNESEGGSAIIDKGTNNIYRRDSLVSAQKTYYSDGGWKQRAYFDSCGFQGKIDVVGGTGDIWFENCYFNLGNDGQHLSAQRTDQQTRFGYIFNGCRASGENNYTIARPAAEYPKATWQNSVFGGLMFGTGFGPGRGNLNLTYREYNCTDENGLLVKYHTTEACDPASAVDVYDEGFDGYAVEDVFDTYVKGRVTLAKWTPAVDAKQRTVYGASWNGMALAFAAEESPVYLLECYLPTESEGNTPDLHYRFLETKVLYIYNDPSVYDSIHVRAANGRGGFGVPARVIVNASPVSNTLVTTLTLNAYGYATYSNTNQVRVVGACACQAYFDEENKVVTLSQVKNGLDVIPENTGVVLFGNGGATVEIYTDNADVEGSDQWPANTHNLLPNAKERRTYNHGVLIGDETGEKEAFESIYVMSGGNFKRAGDMSTIGKNKAFFGFKSDKGAATYRIVFVDEEVGIDEIHEVGTLDMIFDIPGRKVDEQKGLIIKNGKVILNK